MPHPASDRPFRTSQTPIAFRDPVFPVETFTASTSLAGGYWMRKYPQVKKFEGEVSGEYLLFFDAKGPVYFSVKNQDKPHLLIVGQSQLSGKSMLTEIFSRNEMARGAFVVVLDPKGEYYRLPTYSLKIKKVSFGSWEVPVKLKPSLLTLDDWKLLIDKFLSGEGKGNAFHLVRRCVLYMKRESQPLDFESLKQRILVEKKGMSKAKWGNLMETIDLFFDDLENTELFDEQSGLDVTQLIQNGFDSLVIDLAAPDDNVYISVVVQNVLEQLFRMKLNNSPHRNRQYDEALWKKRVIVVVEEAGDPEDGLINMTSKLACRNKVERIWGKFGGLNIIGVAVTQYLQSISTKVINNSGSVFVGVLGEANAMQKVASMSILNKTDLALMFNKFGKGNFLDVKKTTSHNDIKIYSVALPEDWDQRKR